jgi:hypothetical protein
VAVFKEFISKVLVLIQCTFGIHYLNMKSSSFYKTTASVFLARRLYSIIALFFSFSLLQLPSLALKYSRGYAK